MLNLKKTQLQKLICEEVFVSKEKQRIVSSEGLESNWLFDFRKIIMRPAVLSLISDLFWEKYQQQYPFQIGCLEVAGIPMVTGLSYSLYFEKQKSVAAFFIRKSRKKHGLLNMIEGTLSDEPVILVDDIINSGKSFIRQVEVLESLGKRVVVVFAILKFRDDSFYEYFQKKGIRVESIFSLDDFKEVLPVQNIVAKEKTPVPMPFEIKWYFKSEQPNYFYVVPKSAPTLDDEKLYFGSDSGNFWALEQMTGKVVWKFKVGFHAKGKYIFSSPIVLNNIVYFGAYDGNVYALDTATGKPVWIFMEADWVGSSPAIAPDLDLVFIGLEFGLFKKRGAIAALRATTGEKVWEFGTTDYVHASPAYSKKQQLVVCGSNNNMVYGLNAKTGSLRWQCATEGEVKARAAFDEQRGWVIFGSHDSYLYIVRSSDGQLVKKIKTGFAIYSTPLIYSDRVYVSSLDKKLYCINLATLQVEWEFQTNGRIFASPIESNGSVYVGANDGRLYEIDPVTGVNTALFQAVERITNAIAVSGDGNRLFVPTFANEILCLTRSDTMQS